jgi:hypothetical protein
MSIVDASLGKRPIPFSVPDSRPVTERRVGDGYRPRLASWALTDFDRHLGGAPHLRMGRANWDTLVILDSRVATSTVALS